MGLLGSSNVYPDILLMLLLRFSVSLRQMKYVMLTFIQMIGFLSPAPTSAEAPSRVEFLDDVGFFSALTLSELSSETLEVLPLTNYDPDQQMDGQGDVECPVCLQEFHKDDAVRVLPFCRHLFHRACLDRWLKQEQFTCPVCRSSLLPDGLCKRQQQREQNIAEDLFAWFSQFNGSGLQGI